MIAKNEPVYATFLEALLLSEYDALTLLFYLAHAIIVMANVNHARSVHKSGTTA